MDTNIQLTKEQCLHDMQNCYQFQTQNILEHGESVALCFEDLLRFLKNEESDFEWRLPDWLLQNCEFLQSQLLPLDLIRTYHVFHDCGKPYCRTVDPEGKHHFPDHARVSYETWMEIDGDEIIGSLIAGDMRAHLASPSDVDSFCSSPFAATWILTAFAELHSNAQMFGGIESTSFKIKWKKLNKFCRRILK